MFFTTFFTSLLTHPLCFSVPVDSSGKPNLNHTLVMATVFYNDTNNMLELHHRLIVQMFVFQCAVFSRYKKRFSVRFKEKLFMKCMVLGSQVAERLGNRASNLKVASSIPGRAKLCCVLGQGTSPYSPFGGTSLYLL